MTFQTTMRKERKTNAQKESTLKKKLIKKLWELCKQVVRARYVRSDGTWVCFTCDRVIQLPKDAHTAHFIPSSVCGVELRYHLQNLRVCCYHCNINLGGNGSEFYPRLVKEIGQKGVDKLFILKIKTVKADLWWYQDKIARYETILAIHTRDGGVLVE